jgi:hypothetical protein
VGLHDERDSSKESCTQSASDVPQQATHSSTHQKALRANVAATVLGRVGVRAQAHKVHHARLVEPMVAGSGVWPVEEVGRLN